MTLSLDTSLLDVEAWEADLSPTGDWLYPLWGIRPGESSPRSSRASVHPAVRAGAGWLRALWGFGV